MSGYTDDPSVDYGSTTLRGNSLKQCVCCDCGTTTLCTHGACINCHGMGLCHHG